jgi:hypothetical protein
LFFPRQPGRILQARQNFASPNFCLGSLERFRAEQNQIPEFSHAYTELERVSECLEYFMAQILSFSMVLKCFMVKIIRFSMVAMCHGQNRQFQPIWKGHSQYCQFQHGWNVSWSKSSVSAYLEDWNISWSKLSVSTWLECVMVKIIRFSMARMCHGLNCPFQHG